MALGSLSAKYESNGNPGTVSTGWGDAGGISYGSYQLSSRMGAARSFVHWLCNQGYSYGLSLGRYEPGTEAFSDAWRALAAEDAAGFGQAQHDYIKYAYYDPAVRLLKQNNYDVESNHHEVMRDVVWSRAVQYGTGNIVEMFNEAAAAINPEWLNMSYLDAPNFDAAMIRAIYLDVCSTPEWTNGSPALREGLYNRFSNECEDALGRL